MRVAIVDGIEERAPVESLAKALAVRGHDVLATGRLTTGFTLDLSDGDQARVRTALDRVLAFQPDAVLVARPAAVSRADLRRLRAGGAVLLAWLSDDPVLWRPVYRHVVDEYDVLLHCGGADVISFYESKHPGVAGVDFPFWADPSTHPPVAGTREPTHDLLFLGNTHDAVRRARYELLASISSSVLFHGRHGGHDPEGLWAGYLDSDEERAFAASHVRAALSVSQQFADYRHHPWWFDGLDRFGEFELPSRIAQYAAYGLPVVHVRPDGARLRLMPEVEVARDAAGVDEVLRSWEDAGARAEAGRAMLRRGRRFFSAESRAMMLEHLVEHDDWRGLSAVDRAQLFERFDAEPATAPSAMSAVAVPERCGPRSQQDPPVPRFTGVVGVLGQGWTRPASRVVVAAEALEAVGHDVVRLNPWALREQISSVEGRFVQGVVPLSAVVRRAPDLDVLLVVGREYALDKDVAATVRCVLWTDAPRTWDAECERLVEGFDTVAHVDADAVEAYEREAGRVVLHVPEPAPSRIASQVEATAQIGVLADHTEDLGPFETLLGADGVALYVDDRDGASPEGAERLAAALGAPVVVVVPDVARGRAGRLLPWALKVAPTVVAPRAGGPCVQAGAGRYLLGADSPEEMRLKLAAPSEVALAAQRRERARAHIEQRHEAGAILDRLVRSAAARPGDPHIDTQRRPVLFHALRRAFVPRGPSRTKRARN